MPTPTPPLLARVSTFLRALTAACRAAERVLRSLLV